MMKAVEDVEGVEDVDDDEVVDFVEGVVVAFSSWVTVLVSVLATDSFAGVVFGVVDLDVADEVVLFETDGDETGFVVTAVSDFFTDSVDGVTSANKVPFP